MHASALLPAGRDVFGRGSGDKGASVVYMAPIPPADSQRLHLLTVTADGRRVFWSTVPARYGVPPDSEWADDTLSAFCPVKAGRMARGGHTPYAGLHAGCLTVRHFLLESPK